MRGELRKKDMKQGDAKGIPQNDDYGSTQDDSYDPHREGGQPNRRGAENSMKHLFLEMKLIEK